MKSSLQISKGWLQITGIVFLTAIMLSSCVKNHNDYVAPAIAALAVINTSPDAPETDLYLDNNRVNNFPFNYGDELGYFNAFAGKRRVILYAEGTQNKLASDSISLKTNNSYTLFISNLIANPDFILLADTLTKPASGLAAVRFINASPNAPAVDFIIKNGAVLFTNKAYKSFTGFTGTAASVNDTLEVRQTGTNTILASIPNVTLTRSVAYTFWLQGLTNATIDKQKLSIMGMVNGGF